MGSKRKKSQDKAPNDLHLLDESEPINEHLTVSYIEKDSMDLSGVDEEETTHQQKGTKLKVARKSTKASSFQNK